MSVNALIAAPGQEMNARARWLPTKWDWVDPLKDANAEIAQIEAGLKSRTQAIAERGYDAEQVDREIAAERDRERRLGLDFRRPGSPAQAPGARSPMPGSCPAEGSYHARILVIMFMKCSIRNGGKTGNYPIINSDFTRSIPSATRSASP